MSRARARMLLAGRSEPLPAVPGKRIASAAAVIAAAIAAAYRFHRIFLIPPPLSVQFRAYARENGAIIDPRKTHGKASAIPHGRNGGRGSSVGPGCGGGHRGGDRDTSPSSCPTAAPERGGGGGCGASPGPPSPPPPGRLSRSSSSNRAALAP